MGLERVLHAGQRRLRVPFRRHLGDDCDIRMALNPVLKSLVALLAVILAQRALEIDHGRRLVADQRHQPLAGMQAVGVRIGAEVRVHRSGVGRRLVDSDERDAGGMRALDILQHRLVIPGYGDDARYFLGDAGVDL